MAIAPFIQMMFLRQKKTELIYKIPYVPTMQNIKHPFFRGKMHLPCLIPEGWLEKKLELLFHEGTPSHHPFLLKKYPAIDPYTTWDIGPAPHFFPWPCRFSRQRCIGKGRNPYSQITILKAIVQATGDSLGARVSESLGQGGVVHGPGGKRNTLWAMRSWMVVFLVMLQQIMWIYDIYISTYRYVYIYI